jgi:translation initiation factor IF-2
VQPTTVQAIELAKEMGVPIIVAANKVAPQLHLSHDCDASPTAAPTQPQPWP